MSELNINCKLKITLEKATFLHDADMFGKQDPFVKITCSGITYKTKVIEEGGKNPVWNETFEMTKIMEEVNKGEKLHIRCFDSDGPIDDHIG